VASIETIRDANGRAIAYQARWRDDQGVQRKQKFRLKADAERHNAEMESAKSRGAYVNVNAKTTFAEYARQWIENRAYGENAGDNRASQLRTHIEGTRLGATRLVAVKHSDVQAWITERVRVPLAPSTVRAYLGLVRAIFRSAEQDLLIGRNPAAGRFMLPEADAVPIVPLTVDEVRLLSAGVEPRKRALVIVQAATGLRAGELLGLRLEHVNMLRRELYVREQIHPRKRHVMPSLKTPQSRRDLPLPQVATDALAAHLAHFPANSDGYLFTDHAGSPWIYSTYNKSIVRAAEKAGLPHTTSHDLRHHYASVLLDAGESVITVAARLGHANAQLVLTTYGHLMPGSEDRTRRAVDGAWSTACALDVPSEAQTST
jgi:integrase